MEKMKKQSCLNAVSFGAVLGALWLLLTVCGQCAPEATQWVRERLTGLEGSKAQAAFSVLAQGLENGEPLRQAISESVEILREREG